ncbi:hypothetical protein TRVL_09963 [Trypanosoma vivax]|nr:hypothetical protein TRVL_09963 [Trypanosoma vivax]
MLVAPSAPMSHQTHFFFREEVERANFNRCDWAVAGKRLTATREEVCSITDALGRMKLFEFFQVMPQLLAIFVRAIHRTCGDGPSRCTADCRGTSKKGQGRRHVRRWQRAQVPLVCKEVHRTRVAAQANDTETPGEAAIERCHGGSGRTRQRRRGRAGGT